MTVPSTRCLAAAIVASIVLLAGASARGESSAYDVDERGPFSLRALLDARAVRQGPQPSWLENGPGKTRYGGTLDQGQAETVARFALAQLALEPMVRLPWGIEGRAQLNWDVDIAVDGDFGAYQDGPRLVEAFFRKEWGAGASGWAAQAGVMNPPFSLEHSGPARTPRLTLSASAANSWLWEEGRPVGVEGEWWGSGWKKTQLDAFAGFGWGPDQLGILLANRGWDLNDWLSGVNSDLPIPSNGQETAVFDEIDGRPALYLGGSVADADNVAELHLGYFDNLGNLDDAGVWETRYGTAGVAVQPLDGLEILMQGLIGWTTTRGAALESRFSAWYPLVSYFYRGNRVSLRYDNFQVNDEDGGIATDESGYALTFAYMYEFWLRHRVAFEYIYVDSERPGSTPVHLSQGGWQISYRFRY